MKGNVGRGPGIPTCPYGWRQTLMGTWRNPDAWKVHHRHQGMDVNAKAASRTSTRSRGIKKSRRRNKNGSDGKNAIVERGSESKVLEGWKTGWDNERDATKSWRSRESLVEEDGNRWKIRLRNEGKIAEEVGGSENTCSRIEGSRRLASTADASSVTAPGTWKLGRAQGMLLLNLSAMLFGSNQVAIKQTESLLTGGALSAGRFGLAAIVFLPSILEGLRDSKARKAAAELGTWLFVGYQLQAYGLEHTTASHGAFSGTFTVLAVPILAGFSGRRIPWSTWIAAVIAVFGVGLLTWDGTVGGEDASVLGDTLCVFSAFFFGIHKWRTEKYTAELENTEKLMALQIGVLAGASILASMPELIEYLRDHGIPETLTAGTKLPWLELGYMALFTTSLTLWIEVEALKVVTAPTAALIYTAEPLWGTIFAYFLLGDRFGPTGWVGASLIIASSLVAQFFGEDRDPKAAVKSSVSRMR